MMQNDRVGKVIFWMVVAIIIVGFVGSFRVKGADGMVQALACETVGQVEEIATAYFDKKDVGKTIEAINQRDGKSACGVAQMVVESIEVVKEATHNDKTFSVMKLKVVAVVAMTQLIPLEAEWYSLRIPVQPAMTGMDV